MTVFAYPYVFVLLILPILIFVIIPPMRKIEDDALRVPFIDDLINIKNSSKGILSPCTVVGSEKIFSSAPINRISSLFSISEYPSYIIKLLYPSLMPKASLLINLL